VSFLHVQAPDITKSRGNSLERGLRRFLAADVVGYAWLTSADEEGNRLRLLIYRHEVIEPKIRHYRGRV
jgi:class 3 adenylate cyclase